MAKRAFDVVVATVGLLLLAPVLLGLALAVRVTSRGPVVFTQTRIGRGGRPFTMYKFRTLRWQPEQSRGATDVPDVSDFASYVFDPLYGGKRYTLIGHLLRTGSLDELPNLYNVVRGDMSIVGPRPEVPALVAQYPREYHRRHEVRPGITGLAQVNGRGSLTYEQAMVYDLEYVDDHSLLRDLAILARTVPVVLSRKGAQ